MESLAEQFDGACKVLAESSCSRACFRDGYLDFVVLDYFDLDGASQVISSGFQFMSGRVDLCWGRPNKEPQRQVLTHSAVGARCSVFADINGDGWTDFFVIYEIINTVSAWVFQPPNNFTEIVISKSHAMPSWVRSSDLDRNGKPDLLVSVRESGQIVAFFNFFPEVSALSCFKRTFLLLSSWTVESALQSP